MNYLQNSNDWGLDANVLTEHDLEIIFNNIAEEYISIVSIISVNNTWILDLEDESDLENIIRIEIKKTPSLTKVLSSAISPKRISLKNQ